MIGRIRQQGDDRLEELGQQYLEQAEAATDLALTEIFDDVKSERLPENVPAAVRYKRSGLGYEQVELLLDDEFAYLPGDEKLNATIHEGIHGMDKRDRLDRALADLGMDRDAASTVDRLVSYSDESTMEGVVQNLANALDPNDAGRYFRPDETRQAASVLDDHGIDLEEEIGDMIVPSADRQYGGVGSTGSAVLEYSFTENSYTEIGIEENQLYSTDVYGLDPDADCEEAFLEDEELYAGAEPVYDPGECAS